ANWPIPLPALAALPVGAGLALAVGRWRGHRLDGLAWDLGVHVVRNYQIELWRDFEALFKLGVRGPKSGGPGRVVSVTSLEHGVGTTTISLELAVALALTGEQVQLWEQGQEVSLRLGLMAPGRHSESGVELLSGYSAASPHQWVLVRSLPPGEPIQPGGRVVLVLRQGHPEPLPPGV